MNPATGETVLGSCPRGRCIIGRDHRRESLRSHLLPPPEIEDPGELLSVDRSLELESEGQFTLSLHPEAASPIEVLVDAGRM